MVAVSPSELKIGACYSNGSFGNQWQVRQVIGVDATGVRYKVIVGEGRRATFLCAPSEFRSWARYEVERDENNWRTRRQS